MAKRRKRKGSRAGRTSTGRFKKGHRSGRRRRSRGGRRRKSSGRRRASRRAPRRASRRRSRRGLRARGWTHHKVNVWKKGRRYRQGSRRGMLRGHRVNPPLIPSLRSVTGIVRGGAFAGLGWMGVSGVRMALNRFGLMNWAASQSPMVQALIDTASRVLAVPVVAYVSGMVVKNSEDRRAIVLGASANAIINGAKAIGQASGQMPAIVNELLGDGPGFADYLTMSDYVQGFGSDGKPFTTENANPLVSTEGAFI